MNYQANLSSPQELVTPEQGGPLVVQLVQSVQSVSVAFSSVLRVAPRFQFSSQGCSRFQVSQGCSRSRSKERVQRSKQEQVSNSYNNYALRVANSVCYMRRNMFLHNKPSFFSNLSPQASAKVLVNCVMKQSNCVYSCQP